MVSVQFSWGAEVKDVSSIWIGTSPEFELALYTLVRSTSPPAPAALLCAMRNRAGICWDALATKGFAPPPCIVSNMLPRDRRLT